ncbi:hypothetical protein MBRU_11855 [Mycolicibacterium brumae DSM 44177]|nr:hypothetical protein MBRU_11855 [Mycolicibacterium brumae DSM 44177]
MRASGVGNLARANRAIGLNWIVLLGWIAYVGIDLSAYR